MRRLLGLCTIAWLTGCSGDSHVSVVPTSVAPRVSVLTHHNDNRRTGANLAETVLTPDSVRNHFGQLFTLFVDGFVYAQPLVVAGVDFGSGNVHDVVYVATEHDSLYAFDANDGELLWQRSLGPSSNLKCFPEQILTPEIGITSTPVVDPTSKTLYVVAFTQDDPSSCAPTSFHETLHALDLVTGDDTLVPVDIEATTPIPFVPPKQHARAALLLSNGILYTAYASIGGIEPYHGWLFAFDPSTLTQLGVFVTTPRGRSGGIWMGGEGPSSIDDGNLFVSTGNGGWNGVDQWADSLLELTLKRDGRFAIVDSFTPHNQADLDRLDLDLGSTGVLLIPGMHTLGGVPRNLAVIAGKQGKMYLLDRDHLGGFSLISDQVLQTVNITSWNIDGSAVWFDDGATGRVYIWGANAALSAFALADSPSGEFLTDDSATTVPLIKGLPGGMLSISANGTAGGILWANHPWSADGSDANAIAKIVPGVLHAFDATDLTIELWNNRDDSRMTADSVGDFAKFCPPTIANGKVYFAAWSREPGKPPGRVIVFGVRP